MLIGTVRPEEAKSLDSRAGYHSMQLGSVEVFWNDEKNHPTFNGAGWYWWMCLPNCLPDTFPVGPFSSSIHAFYNALEDVDND